MIKFAAIPLAIVAGIVPLVAADNCTPGLDYCGQGLLSKGNYADQIRGALQAAGQPTDDDHVRRALFHCDGGAQGAIHFITVCGTCKDGGGGRNDFC
ncbi:hypothetical protein G6O67_007916 [Ophiocordyceps sinensis]|uniref:Uncharacterized protein n=2 Tax=Ophiocordyceps sinensis TaxID=72228 RepID=A0A8H4LSQ9_9HYPO|nr:hypothetical protein OCS_04610 [Ophiocordyceps sinensis CO18]KAF4504466.1 hypothetical protein G6O67_007916 [Ophiocordyceps sinensis]